MTAELWKKLKKPIFVLAPMADVTDAAFRQIIAKYGKPDVMFTEFVSCDGLCSSGKNKLLRDLKFTESERPIVAQFFGDKPENFYECARLAQELGFDGIDINMGCPQKNIIKQNAGAKLIENPALAKKIISKTKQGAGKLPVSVKTRIGYNENIITEWMKHLLDAEPAAITIHGRTKKEMSKAPAHWDAISEAVKIRNEAQSKTLILGNGDVKNLIEAREKTKKYNVDGIMIGRGIFGNPWLFSQEKRKISINEKLSVAIEHTILFEKIFEKNKNFNLMKKHYKAYVSGFVGAKELRIKLMNAKNSSEVFEIINDRFRL